MIIWSIVVAAIGLLLTVISIIDKVITMGERSHRPWDEMVSRIRSLEEWKKEVDRRLEEGDKRFDGIEKGNQVTQKVLLALLDYYLNKDNSDAIDELKKARAELYNYVTEH